MGPGVGGWVGVFKGEGGWVPEALMPEESNLGMSCLHTWHQTLGSGGMEPMRMLLRDIKMPILITATLYK